MHIQGGINVRGQCRNKRTKTGDFNRLLPYGEGHVASAYSILDILYVLYDRVLDCGMIKKNSETRDRFILSKGHAAIGYYAVLKKFGFIEENLDTMCAYGSRLGGHPDCNKVPGVEASTGSLGHGVPMAVGMALGFKIKGNPAHVYTLAGDGEINEGSIWESFLVLNHNKLNHFTFILDYNHSTDRAVDLGDIGAKFCSFGFHVIKINGHDHAAIEKALRWRGDKPVAILAETVKGRGITGMEDNPAWHHRIPTGEEYRMFMEELS